MTMPKPRNLEGIAYQYIVQHIQSRQWLPQTHITEQKLSQTLKMSRTPIRQAFVRLQKEGYITIEPYKGARIQEPGIDSDGYQERAEFAEMILIQYLHQLQIKELHFDTAKLIELQEELEQFTQKGKKERFFEIEILYWSELMKYSKNSYSVSILLDTFRSMNHQNGKEINEIIEQASPLKLKHMKNLTHYVTNQEYALARKEVRILINQLSLAAIQGF